VEPTLKPARRNRALRKRFAAAIVITDMASERQLSARTSDLSVHGCFVTTPTPSNPGAKVRVTIVHAGAKMVALGHVVSTHAEGMGIAFTSIEPGDQAILELWMSDLRVK
jgi:PilZ domain